MGAPAAAAAAVRPCPLLLQLSPPAACASFVASRACATAPALFGECSSRLLQQRHGVTFKSTLALLLPLPSRPAGEYVAVEKLESVLGKCSLVEQIWCAPTPNACGVTSASLNHHDALHCLGQHLTRPSTPIRT